MSTLYAAEQRRISGAIFELGVAAERLGEAGAELAAAGRLGWTQDAAKLQAAVELLLERVQENRR